MAIVSLMITLGFAAPDPASLRRASSSEGRKVVDGYTGSYALIIGVGNYNEKGWPTLNAVRGEMKLIEDELESMGFEVERVDDPKEAELEASFKNFITKYGYDSDNRLLFFFSGHGFIRREDGLGYLVPADAPYSPEEPEKIYSRSLSTKRIEAYCYEMMVKHALFIFDACFSGTVFNAAALPKDPPHISAEPVRQFITSGRADEKVPGQSDFALFFIEALRGKADINGDGFITGTELGMYLQGKFADLAKKQNRKLQTPQYGKIDDLRFNGGDFVFALPCRLFVNTVPVDARVRILNIGPKFFSGMGLAPGDYLLEVSADGYPTYEETITITPGEIYKERSIDLNFSVPNQRFTNVLGMEFVYISPAGFMMGGHWEEKEAEPGKDEQRHQVTLTRGYYLQTKEVTQGQWQRLMGENPSAFQSCGPNCPVESVSWDDVQKFISKLNQSDKQHTYRLPTEAEWEYAARAGSDSAFAQGDMTEKECRKDSILAALGWYCYNSDNSPRPVGLKSSNAWGLYDMHGNVWEWCRDLYDDYPSGSVRDPKGPASSSGAYHRIYRGGGWSDPVHRCRSAYRGRAFPDTRCSNGGFRLAVALASEEAAALPEPSPEKDTSPYITRTAMGREFKNRWKMEFVEIVPGPFMMGSPDGEKGRYDDETRHRANLKERFYMQVTEVTQRQWQAVMGANPSKFQNCGENCPVENVSFDDAQEFIDTLNQSEKGIRYRLPTEAEWEFAARANSTGAFAAGDIAEESCQKDSALDTMGWYCYNSNNSPHPVALKFPNAWRLHDMHGNVWEWCRDRYGNYPKGTVSDPKGPDSGDHRVLRGGSGNQMARACRSAVRNKADPSDRYEWHGFRLIAIEAAAQESGDLNSDPLAGPSIPDAAIPFKNSVGMKFVRVDAGSFTMGSPVGEKGRGERGSDENQHRVSLKAYYLQTTEVTQKQWQEIMGDNPSKFQSEDKKWSDNYPVENVSFNDIQKFISKLNQSDTEHTYRLPTEAEWEYAARAGSHGAFAYGDITETECNKDSVLDGMGWYCYNSDNSTHPVAMKAPNAWGLFDMHGNVSEWCGDRYRYDHRHSDGLKALRVIRGGSWNKPARRCRSASRVGIGFEKKGDDMGFRLAFSLPNE